MQKIFSLIGNFFVKFGYLDSLFPAIVRTFLHLGKSALKLGKSVSDNGWGMFTAFLKYKLEEQGKKLVKVDRFFASSQMCSACGYKNAKTKDLALRQWDCPQCGIHHDRDVNAAINIRNEGMRIVTA